MWGSNASIAASESTDSLSPTPSQSAAVEFPLPMSASSSSTSSQPLFDWRIPKPTSPRTRMDPFDTFDPVSSSSEDDPVPQESRRAGHQRSVTDPLLRDGQPLDMEFTTARPPIQSYDFEQPPTFSRTLSSPLPAKVGSLRHPMPFTIDDLSSRNVNSTHRPQPTTPLHSISVELADSLQSAIQTLLHLSPPHLLDNAKEQYSGCTVQIPATSLSALLTSMRGLNFLSAHAEELVDLSAHGDPPVLNQEDFDVGELLQNVADMLSGEAAEKRIDFVLFHGDVAMRHVSVYGDSDGISYTLSHVIRQILAVANYDDTIELGLQVIPQSPSLASAVGLPLTSADVSGCGGAKSASTSRSGSPNNSLSRSNSVQDGPLLCLFEIVHNIYQPPPSSASATPKAELNPFTHLAEETEALKPRLDTAFCKNLLHRQNAVLKVDVQPSSPLGSGMPRRAYALSVLLPRGKPITEPAILSKEEQEVRQPFSSHVLAREPTLNELSEFAESLRGRKVFIHANLSSVFARHLTSYLAAWGMDISHLPTDGDEADKLKDVAAKHDSAYTGSMGVSGGTTSSAETPYSIKPTGVTAVQPGHFVIIDDDVAVLRRELVRIRSELLPILFKPRLSKRPTMTSRTRSTPSVRQAPPRSSSGSVLIHFTSLANYNRVRDAIASFVGAPGLTNPETYVQPEVIVIPKPVGPRRFLTALHTAVKQPMVDPFFSPIATSPRSPGGGYFGGLRTPTERESGFFDSVAEEPHEEADSRPDYATVQKARSPLGEFPPSAAQIVRTNQGLHLSLPTPNEIMTTPAPEYFSGSSKSPSSGASGVVMQSPDGRPFGMFFEPPIKNERRGSTHRTPSDSIRRKQANRRASTSDEPFSSPSTALPPRRSSTISTTGNEEHRSSPIANVTDRPTHSRVNSRRKNNLPAAEQPILAVGRAKGRERSETVTKGGDPGSRKGTPAASPRIEEKKELERGEKAKSLAPSTAPTKKNAKVDVVVPPINVLIVEDNPINQNILSMFLRKKKIKNSSAKDGAEAVEKWRTGGFHLILMDIQLPVMDGIAATKEIRRLERHNNIGVFPSTPAAELPRGQNVADSPTPSSPFRSSVIIVALTASSLQSDRVAALAAGCNDFLTKPVSLKWLDKKIVEWGCMQALIDFDGWRRWKSSDTKNPSETKQGFSVGPQQAARSLASRLRIERKGSRSPAAPVSTPRLNLQSATPDRPETPPESTSQMPKAPPVAASDPPLSPKSLNKTVNDVFEQADARLENAREEQGVSSQKENTSLTDSTNTTITPSKTYPAPPS
ncbi:osomolarity two-component system, response regulator SSK1 [Cryptococcus neoformans Bt85]|nr:osomolarity two-component system, response regulator SSK1 [Cryptococcus neoformans var. grubii Bt85]